MAYKHIETIGGYNIPGRGQVFVTLDRSVKPGEVVEIGGKNWKVVVVEVADSQPHAGLVVIPFTESDAKRETAADAKKMLQVLFAPVLEAADVADDSQADVPPAIEAVLQNPVAGLLKPNIPKPNIPKPKVQLTDEQRLKLLAVFQELTSHLIAVRDWAVAELSKFNLGEDPPSIMLMAVSMPREGMAEYLSTLEPFLVQSVEQLEKEGKLPWANVKAVVGVKR